jgi:Fe-S-cluster-containing dehydrogenase component/formate-dependent nitrite reductase membrane component NrfD
MQTVDPQTRPTRWAKVIDHSRCIGCHACTTACKSENDVPLSVTRTYVKYVDVGTFPQARRAFQVTRCNQCEDAPCVAACPTSAMHQRPDGIVDFDKSICIGCKACIAACPYDAIFINPVDGSAEKCNFCAHRLDIGLEPACVVVCPTEAILIGDLDDPNAEVSHIVNREPVAVRRPEKDTNPKLFYKAAHQATLDPIAARRPDGGIFMWSEQPSGSGLVVSGHPATNRADGHAPASSGRASTPANSSAAAILSYDVGHSIPWDWRVSAYTLTKGIAAGAYIVSALLLVGGLIDGDSLLWRWIAPLIAFLFLGLTGVLLIWDLEHPTRFYLIFTRPQWRSWLVRGAFVIGGYGALLTAHLAASLTGTTELLRPLIYAGLPLGLMTAVYTAYLFAQSKARDLWQNPLLPLHFLVEATLSGAAALAAVAVVWEPAHLPPLLWTVAAGSLANLLLVAGEITLSHPTAHARLAVWEMVRGRYRGFFRAGVTALAVAVLAPWIGAIAAPLAIAGLFAYEHAYVQAGQAVPLA